MPASCQFLNNPPPATWHGGYAALCLNDVTKITGLRAEENSVVEHNTQDLGMSVLAELRRPPSGTLPLRHSHDDLEKKEVYRALK